MSHTMTPSEIVSELDKHIIGQTKAKKAVAAPAVAQCDRNGLLGLALTDDMFVEFRDDLGRRHLGHWGPLPARREHSPLRRLCGLMA